MKLEGPVDLETSVRIAEFVLMKELPQFDTDKIDRLPLKRAAYYIALAEDVARRRKAAMDTASRRMRRG